MNKNRSVPSHRLRACKLRFDRLENRELLSVGNTGDGSLLIQLLPGQSPAAVASLVSADSAFMRTTSIPGLLEVTGSSTELANLLADAAISPSVQYAEPNHTVHLDLMPNDPSFTNGTLWGLNGTNGIHAPAAWDVTTGSTKVTIADIDTGHGLQPSRPVPERLDQPGGDPARRAWRTSPTSTATG